MYFEFKEEMCDSIHIFQVSILFRASGQNESLIQYLFKKPTARSLERSLVDIQSQPLPIP